MSYQPQYDQYGRPIQPTQGQQYYQPSYSGQPAYGQPAHPHPQPVYAQPAAYGQAQPVYNQPYYAQPVNQSPSYGQPSSEYVGGQPAYAQQQTPYDPEQAPPHYDQPHSSRNPSSSFDEDQSAALNKGARFSYNTGFRDLPFLLAFLAHLIGMFIVAGYFGPQMLRDIKNNNQGSNNNTNNAPSSLDENKMIAILVVSAILSSVFCAVWLRVMKIYAASIIKITVVCNIAMLLLSCIVSFAYGAILMGVLYLLFAGLTAFWYYCVQNRIPFAQATLKASVNAIQDSPGPIYVTYGVAVLQIGWVAFWAFTFAAVYHAGNKPGESPSGAQKFAYFFLVLSLYWTSQVLKNIAHVTTAGVVAAFWFTPNSVQPSWNSFKRATTTSLGSICFGSFILAFIKALRWAIQTGKRNASNDIVRCLLDCFLGCIEGMVQYFNQYAFTNVAIYGNDFITAAKETWQLFKGKLFEAIINDDLTGMCLWLGAFLAGAFAGLFGCIWAATANFDGWMYIGALSFVIGVAVATLFFTVIESAVCTTFVCWAEDPMALQQNRPAEFSEIAYAAEPLYGWDHRIPRQQA